MKRKKSHRVLRLIIFMIVVIICGIGGGVYYYNQQHIKASFNARPDLVKAKDGTSVSPGHHSLAAFKKQLSRNYPHLYTAVYETPKTTKIGADVVIPGQIVTPAYNFKKNKLSDSSTMTPQGLAIADNYILITAYDSLHQSNSVIYVLNRKNGKYIKTIYLGGRPHLGGIAYDPVAKKIWLTGTSNDEAALVSFSLKQLKNYDYYKDKKFLKYEDVIGLPTIQQASCVTYYDNQLFVGFFNEYGNGQLVAYPIARQEPFKNSITSDQIKAVTGKVTWSAGAGSTTMDQQIQGVTFYNNYVILSQSYGAKSSKLYFFPISAINNLDEKNAEKIVECPPYLEQITVVKDQLLMIFESGAKAYSKNGVLSIDRIISANINALIGSN